MQAKVNAARSGDFILIPPGVFTWAQPLTVTQNITIYGAGAGKTIIIPAGTVSNKPFWVINHKANGITDINGIEFRGGSYSGSGGIINGGFLRVNGSNTDGWQFHLHHCKFTDIKGYCLIPKSVIGLVDHNLFEGVDQIAHINGEDWDGKPNGSGSWAAPTNAGSLHTLVFEDNVYHRNGGCVSLTFFDANRGGRVTIRHGTFNTSCPGAIITMHGLENNNRGTCEVEVYDNLFEYVPSDRLGNQRAGIQIWFNGIVAGGPGGTSIDLTFDRGYSGSHWDNVWGGSYGDNKWDHNDSASYGTVTATGGGTNKLVVSGAGWRSNQWVGYSIKRVGGTAGGTIISNSTDTITTTGDGGFGSPLVVSAGQQYKILRVLDPMDAVGRAGGSQINSATSAVPSGWNNQVTEGCWEWNCYKKTSGPIGNWNNPGNAININFSPQNPVIRDFAIGNSPAHYHNDTVKPGYPWDASKTARVGAAGNGPWTAADVASTQMVAGGDGGGPYPHPLAKP